MALDSDIIVVSGLPRSGTSAMMQMLDAGGIPALTDRLRAADIDNPRGYFEFEPVKHMQRDASWLPSARGKVVKMVSPLLYDLPQTESYRVIFMEREISEVLESQERMLQRLNRPVTPRGPMQASFAIHLDRLFAWLRRQPHMQVLTVNYNSLLRHPESVVPMVVDFLDGRPTASRMLAAIDVGLYRNRSQSESRTADGPQGT